MTRAAALEDLVARRDIRTVLTRYCRALDRADLDLMKTVYWPDGVDVHGIFEGKAHAFAEYIIREIQVFFAMGTHCLLNCHIDVDGDVAASETYLYSICRVRPEQRDSRRNGEWRILQRQVVSDWNDNGPSGEVLDQGMFATLQPRGTRDGADLVFANTPAEAARTGAG